jgi:hypothetical protein
LQAVLRTLKIRRSQEYHKVVRFVRYECNHA